MEINPAGVILAFALVFIIAFFAAMVIVMILQGLHLIRIKQNSHFILLSMGIAIVLIVAFWLLKTGINKRHRSSDRIDIVVDTSTKQPMYK